jgi:hypothetical protein
MFGWILNKWRNWRIAKQRLLYSYWDGKTQRRGDPFRIWREIENDTSIDLDTMAVFVDGGREPETSLMVEAIARAFRVERWNEETQSGLIDWEIIDLLIYLQSFMLALKKNISPGQTSPTITESASSTLPEALADPTNASLDSGSTSSEPKPETATAS